MADRQFNIEVLVRARNAAAQAMNSFAKDVGKTDDNIKKLSDSSKDANKNMASIDKTTEKLSGHLKTFNENAKAVSQSLSTFNERFKTFSNETLTATKRQRAQNEASKELSGTIRQVTRDLEKFAGVVQSGGQTSSKATKEIDKQKTSIIDLGDESEKSSKKMVHLGSEVDKLQRRLKARFGNDFDDLNRAITKTQNLITQTKGNIADLKDKIKTVGGTETDQASIKALGNKLDSLQRQLAILRGYKAKIDIDLTGDIKTKAKILEIKAELERLNKQVANPKVGADSAELARHKIQVLRTELERLNKTSLDDYDKSLSDLEKTTNRFTETDKKKTRSIREENNELKHASSNASNTNNVFRQFSDTLLGFNTKSRNANNNLRDLALSSRGFAIAFVIKYAQTLTTAITGLVAEVVAAGAAFIGAGAALGGAFTAAILQAIPAVGLLIAALVRAKAVIDVLNLRQQIKESSLHNRERDTRQAKTQTDQLINSQEALASANESVTRAQQELTKAREEGRLELQDLILAERQAELAARGAVLSQEEAQRALRAALDTGDQAAIARARLNIQSSNVDVSQRNIISSRSSQEAGQARRGGVEGLDRVVNARRSLAEAEKQAARASRDLSSAQDDVAQATAGNTAQQDKLVFLLSQLSPAEKRLTNALISFKDTYKRAFRGVTDIIVDSFAVSVRRAQSILEDDRIIRSAASLARRLSSEMNKFSEFASGQESRNFLTFLSGEADFNLRRSSDLLISASRAIMNIAEAASPLFTHILEVVRELVEKLEFDTSGARAEKFFDRVKLDFDAILGLATELGRLFDAIFEPAETVGRTRISKLTEDLESFNKKIEGQPDAVRKFFEDSDKIFESFFNVLKALAIEIALAFKPDAVEDFARVVIEVFIPALGNAVRAMGAVTRAIQFMIGQPFVREIAQFAFSIFLFTRSIVALRSAAASIADVFAALFGSASKSTSAFNVFGRTLILSVASVFVIQRVLKELGIALDSLPIKLSAVSLVLAGIALQLRTAGRAFAIFRGTVALQTAGALAGVTGFVTKSKVALGALGVAFKTNPFGLLITGIGLAATALSFFIVRNKSAKSSVEDLTDALERQVDSYRALRDQQLQERDAALAVRSSNLSLARARHDLNEVTKEANKDGKRTVSESRDIREAQLRVEQAELDLIRARRRSKDTTSDKDKVEKEASKTSKETVNKARDNVSILTKERDRLKEKIEKLKEHDGQVLVGNRGQRVTINNSDDLAKANDKLKDVENRLTSANDELRVATRRAGRAFKIMGGNATDFGLNYGDIIKLIQETTNDTLSAFGAKKIKFNASLPKLRTDSSSSSASSSLGLPDIGGFPKAQGGFLDGFGNQDTIPILAAPDEAVLNRHQVPYVDSALRAAGMWGGLPELFSRVQTPHYMARGGYVQQAAADGSKHLTSATKSFAEKMFKLGFNVTSAFRPGDPRQHGSGSALDFGNSVNDLKKLWSTVFPIRSQFNQLLGPPGLYNGTQQFFNKGLQAEHMDHIHIGFKNMVNAVLGSISSTVIPPMKLKSTQPDSFLNTILRGGERTIRRAANRFLEKKMGETDPSEGDISADKVAGGLGAGRVKRIAQQALEMLNVSRNKSTWTSMLVSRAAQESAFNPNAKNDWDINAKQGNPSVGLMQTTGSTFRSYALAGHKNILNPLDNMLASIRYMIARYGGGNQSRALQAMLARNAAKQPYFRGGMVKSAAQGQAPTVIGSRPQFPRLGSGKVTGSDLIKIFETLLSDNIFDGVVKDFKAIIKKLESKKASIRKKAERDLTDDENGILARIVKQIEELTTQLANKLKARSIEINNKTGKVTTILSPQDIAEQEINDKKQEQEALIAERAGILRAEQAARKSGNKKLEKDLRTKRETIEAGISDLQTSIQESIDSVFNSKTEAVKDAASRALGGVDRARRVGAIAGVTSGFSQQEADILTTQKDQLSQILSKSKGISPAARAEIEDQIAELSVQIAEKAAAAAREQVDSINKVAENRFRLIGLKERLTDLVGRRTAGGQVSALAGRWSLLQERQGALSEQFNSLFAARSQAAASGNFALVEELNVQLDDLNVQMQENIVAMQENTDAIRSANIDQILGRNSFISGVLGQGISILQSLGNITGQTLNTQLISTLLGQSVQQALGTVGSLAGQLGPLLQRLGINPSQLMSVLNDPTSLVSFLTGISTTNTSNLTPAQKADFERLINEILSLTGSIIGLQDQIEELNGTMQPQSFSTTAWQLFRKAIFNGEGGLIPGFAQLIPQMHTGGMVARSGLFNLQAGEKVIDKNTIQNGGSTHEHNWNITTPTEILDPDYLATVVSFKLATSGAVR